MTDSISFRVNTPSNPTAYCSLFTTRIFLLGNVTNETSLFEYFGDSWATYNNISGYEPAFPPDVVDPEVAEVCQGKVFFPANKFLRDNWWGIY